MTKWAYIENIVIVICMTVGLIMTGSLWWLVGLMFMNYTKNGIGEENENK